MTYSNADRGDYEFFQDSTRIQSSSYDYWWWGITSAVKKWQSGQYGGSSNYVLIIISRDDNTANKDNSFFSSNYSTISKRPYVTVTYDNTLGQAPGITSGMTYHIRNVNSGKYLDVENGIIDVVQYFFKGGAHQKWKVVYESDGYYSLSPVGSSSKVLDLSNGSTSNGNPLWIYGKWPGSQLESDAQRFEIIKVGTVDGANKYKIVPKKMLVRLWKLEALLPMITLWSNYGIILAKYNKNRITLFA